MKTRIQKWGNSLALRIPKTFATEAGLNLDSTVEISLVDGRVIIEPVVAKTLSLDDLLAQIDESNLHGEIDSGAPIGNEAW